MSTGRDEGPIYYREIQKNAYLKRIPNETTSKLLPLGQKKPPLKAMWTLFCVHNGRTPFLEQYPEPESPSTLAHKPVWRACLRSARHVTCSVSPQHGSEYDFLIDTEHGPVRMLAPDWESMQDWVSTLRSKLHELKIVPKGENVYCGAPAPAPPRAAARDPTSPLPAPPQPPDRVPGIELTIPTTRQTQPPAQPTSPPSTPPEATQEPHPGTTQATDNIDISNWEPDSVPSTSQANEPSRSVAKICGQNICLDDSILKRNLESRNATDSDEEFFAEIDRLSVSVDNLSGDVNSDVFKVDHKSTVVVNDVKVGDSDAATGHGHCDRPTNITVIQVSNRPPHTAIPVLGPETNIFNFDFKQNVPVNDNDDRFVNIVNTEDNVNGYDTVFTKESDYGHISLATTVSLTGDVKPDSTDNEGIYERLCLASTSNDNKSPVASRKVDNIRSLDKTRKSSLPNLDTDGTYEYLFPNNNKNTTVTLNNEPTSLILPREVNSNLINNCMNEVRNDPRLNNVRNDPSLNDVRNDPRLNDVRNEPNLNDVRNDLRLTDVRNDPRLTDVRNDPRLNDVRKDPRLNDVRNDPRLNDVRNDPRLNDVRNDPRLNDVRSDPRLNDVRSDPRLNEVRNDPRLNEVRNDPRLNDVRNNISEERVANTNTSENRGVHLVTSTVTVTDHNNRLRNNIERSNSQNAYDTNTRRDVRRAHNHSPKREAKIEKTEAQPKPMWKRGLTELSLLSKLKGFGQGRRQDSPGRRNNNSNDRGGVTSPSKVVHRSRPEARPDTSRRRSSSLSNAHPPLPPPPPPLIPLRARQAAWLRAEQRRGAAIPHSQPHSDPPVFVDYNRHVWIACWGAGGGGHAADGRSGDRVVGVRGVAPRDAAHARQLFKTAHTHMVNILFHRVPLAKIYVISKRDLEPIGLKLDSECAITAAEGGGPCARAALPPPPPGVWAVTEVNNRPLAAGKGCEEEMNRLSLHGTEVSILIQPAPLVKKLRAATRRGRPLLARR